MISIRTVRRQRRGLSVLVCTAALGLPSACGSEAGDGAADVASLGTAVADVDAEDADGSGDADADDGSDDTDPDDGGNEDASDPEDAFLEYAECMRDEGVDMPDPTVSGDGSFVIGAAPVGASGSAEGEFDPTTDEFREAEAACSPILDDAMGSIEIDPEQEAEMREQMLAFAECMREQGLDFPDPTFDGGGRVQMEVGRDGAPPDGERWEEASRTCNEQAGGGPMVFSAGG